LHQHGLEDLEREIKHLAPLTHVGRISEISQDVVKISGLASECSCGDLVQIKATPNETCFAEITQVACDYATAILDRPMRNLSIGAPVYFQENKGIAPNERWLGRIISAYAEPLDGKPLPQGAQSKPLRSPPPNPNHRRDLGERLEAGVPLFNTFLPLVRGQRIGLFAGSGVGKTTLLAQLATKLEADVVVLAMVGERAREVREFAHKVLGPNGMKRTVIVASTSDQSPILRRRSVWAALATAEYFRDQGRHVLFLADSITRFADAHREIAFASGEKGEMKGYPPSVVPMLTSIAERTGPGPIGTGDITAIFSVLVHGSDMENPIADIMRGSLDGHVILDRAISERGRFPAINISKSVSRSLPRAASEQENSTLLKARKLISDYEKSELMIQSGLYSAGSDPNIDDAIKCWPLIDFFAAQSQTLSISESFKALEACFKPKDKSREF